MSREVNGAGLRGRSSRSVDLKSRASAAVEALLRDPAAQRHKILRKSCFRALGRADEFKRESVPDFTDSDPIVDIAVMNVNDKAEKLPAGFQALCNAKGEPIQVLRSMGGRYSLCFRRAAPRELSISMSEVDMVEAEAGSMSTDGHELSYEDQLRDLLDARSQKRRKDEAISDIVVSNRREVPFGYVALTHTTRGMPINSSLVVCFSRIGRAAIKDMAIIDPSKQQPADGYMLLKTNLNDNSSDRAAYLCVAKDFSPYVRLLDRRWEQVGSSNPYGARDPAFLPPILLALHLQDAQLGSEAVQQLRQLVTDGLLDMQSQGLTHKFVSVVLTAVCDSLGATTDHNLQDGLLGLIKTIARKYLHVLSLSNVFDMTLAAFRVVSKKQRNAFLESFGTICVNGHTNVSPQFNIVPMSSEVPVLTPFTRGPSSGGFRRDSSVPDTVDEHSSTAASSSASSASAAVDDVQQEIENDSESGSIAEHFRSLLLGLAENVANAKLTDKLLIRFQSVSLFDPKFRFLLYEIATLVCKSMASQQLAMVVLVLTKLGLESESELVDLNRKYGVLRKHSALDGVHHILNQMHLHMRARATADVHRWATEREQKEEEEWRELREKELESELSYNDPEPEVGDGGGSDDDDDDDDDETATAATHGRRISINMVLGGPGCNVMDKNMAFLFRRFVCTMYCRTLLAQYNPARPDVHQVSSHTFNAVLQAFTALWKKFPHYFKLEMGILMDELLLVYAANPLTATSRRQLIVSTLNEVFDTPQSIMNLYYNYDNISNWFLVERLISVLGRIIEETLSKDGSDEDSLLQDDEIGGRDRGTTVEFDTQIDRVDEKTTINDIGNMEDDPLTRLQALTVGSRWSISANRRRSSGVHTSDAAAAAAAAAATSAAASGSAGSRSTDSLHSDHKAASDQRAVKKLSPLVQLQVAAIDLLVNVLKNVEAWYGIKTAAAEEEREASNTLEVETVDSKKLSVHGRSLRKGTVMHRAAKQKEFKKAVAKAIQIAQEKDVRKAVSFLVSVGALKHNAADVAAWVHDRAGQLGLDQVGDFLGGTRPKQESMFEEHVRYHYIRRLNFANTTLTDALRRFLTQSGFRLPPESQKIDRILESFAAVFCLENPSMFRNRDAAYVLSTAILMLNTSLHNDSVRDRDKLSKDTFVNICTDIKDTNYTRNDYEAIFDDIQSNGYKISLDASFTSQDNEVYADARDQYVRECASAIRKAEAHMKQSVQNSPSFLEATSREVVQSMFSVTWYQFMAILSQLVENTQETRVVTTCIDGFKYALTLCSRLEWSDELGTLATSLAKFQFMFRDRFSETPSDAASLKIAMVTGEHIRNSAWLAPMKNTMLEPAFVAETVDNVKREYIKQSNLKVLRQVQARLNGDTHVDEAGRYFIREGDVDKVSKNGSVEHYHLFLFSDALMYTEEGRNGTYKPHRVLLLVFSSIQPIDNSKYPNAFRIGSPQKSVLFSCKSEKSRTGWIDAINRGIQKQKHKREQLIRAVRALFHSGHAGLNQHDVLLIEKTCAFLGRSAKEIKDGNKAVVVGSPNHCPLCFRRYTAWGSRKRQQCKDCETVVCSSCRSRQVGKGSGKGKKTVCDGCYSFTDQFRDAEREASASYK